jgi:hypothetical protein
VLLVMLVMKMMMMMTTLQPTPCRACSRQLRPCCGNNLIQ